MLQYFFADMHVHSTLQPFGQTFRNSKKTNKQSLWYYNPPKGFKKFLEKLGLSKFSQSNFTAAGKGKVSLMGVSLYAPEISFFANKLGEGNASDALEDFIANYSKERIKEIQTPGYNYFDDLQKQYDFFIKSNNTTNDKYQCKIISKGSDIDLLTENTIGIFVNIEGGHSFDCGYPPITQLSNAQENKVLENVDKVKDWTYRPLYVTIAHHYYNQLVGHCRSLPGLIGTLASQEIGINTAFTSVGEKVIHKLLDNSNGKRVLPDIKHLSVMARKQYYDILKNDYATQKIPIVFSHGGVNGMQSFDNIGSVPPNSLFNNWDINIYNDEALIIVKSNGIIGLNLDERVMSSKFAHYWNDKHAKCKTLAEKQFAWSSILWNHIKYMAELLDKEGLPAWSNVAIGSDFDGVINPIDYFLSVEDYPSLKDNLMKHADQYINSNPPLSNQNLISPSDIISNLMGDNLYRFVKKNY